MGEVSEAIDRLAALLPDEAARAPFKQKVLGEFEIAAGITALMEGTESAPAEPRPPRLKWETDRLLDENPAAFAWRAYRAEAKAGTLHRGVIATEDPPLHRKLKNWLRTHDIPEGIDIPTLPEWNERQLSKLPYLRDDATTREALRLTAVALRRRGR